jgi:hypothetical protein
MIANYLPERPPSPRLPSTRSSTQFCQTQKTAGFPTRSWHQVQHPRDALGMDSVWDDNVETEARYSFPFEAKAVISGVGEVFRFTLSRQQAQHDFDGQGARSCREAKFEQSQGYGLWSLGMEGRLSKSIRQQRSLISECSWRKCFGSRPAWHFRSQDFFSPP